MNPGNEEIKLDSAEKAGILVRRSVVDCSNEQFFDSMKLLIMKPHVLNKRLCGVLDLWNGVRSTAANFDYVVNEVARILRSYDSEVTEEVDELENQQNIEKCFSDTIVALKLNGFVENQNTIEFFDENDENDETLVIVRKVIPKNLKRFRFGFECVFINCKQNFFFFVNNCKFKEFISHESEEHSTSFGALMPCFPYSIQYINSVFQIQIGNEEYPCTSTSFASGVPFLLETVLPRLSKWSKQSLDMEGDRSLSLVNVQQYSVMYNKLKEKYADSLIKSWTERTDPLKYVYEDIGIAAYLLVLWEERSPGKRMRYADLGCGNGLLVYLLNSEGHKGTGYDLRARAIWKTFPPHVDLQEKEILPRDGCLPPDMDWLLGNHSDELTPWMPVLAARLSERCSFFVLPCCRHDFSARYRRQDTSASLNTDYLRYVHRVGTVCGYVTERDRLKIPSTKRICFVGSRKLHPHKERSQLIREIQSFIDERIKLYEKPSVATDGIVSEDADSVAKDDDGQKRCLEDMWVADFMPRPKLQKTRNCTQLDAHVREDLVKNISLVILDNQDEGSLDWAHAVPIANIAAALGREKLSAIKAENGGLSTLLKNHRHVFQLLKGSVMLRKPGTTATEDKRGRPCWFFSNHPQGCPNPTDMCMYNHVM